MLYGSLEKLIFKSGVDTDIQIIFSFLFAIEINGNKKYSEISQWAYFRILFTLMGEQNFGLF
jgi:hypothetical protein